MDFQTIVCDHPGDHGRHAWTERETGNRYECFGTGPLPGFGQPEREDPPHPGLVAMVQRVKAEKGDPVRHPQHYMKHPSGVEIIDITRHHSFTIGNALKYLFRHEHKGRPVEDLRKAIAYIEFAIEDLEKEGK